MSGNSLDAKVSTGLANSLSNVFKLVSYPGRWSAGFRETFLSVVFVFVCGEGETSVARGKKVVVISRLLKGPPNPSLANVESIRMLWMDWVATRTLS